MLQSFKLAIKAILSNKMRAFLTMLGIIIGVSAVIILVSIVQAYTNKVIKDFEEMGVNKITVFTRNMNTRHVTDKEMYAFLDEHPEWFTGLSPSVTLSSIAVKSGTENLTSTSVIGVSEDYLSIQAKELDAGRDLGYSDIANRSSVCIIGAYLAETFYKSASEAISQSIKINGKPFTIIGVLEVLDEDDFDEGGSDDFIWIPYTVATKMSRNGFINNWYFNSSDVKYTDDITTSIKAMLLKKFKNSDLYRVNANSSIITSLNEQVGSLSAMLGGIAGISLLVAGIGVMNIMLVSVTERTREIGIRKALGAKQGVIMQQFIIEAAVLSMLGGIIGIILGSIATGGMGVAMDIEAYPTFSSIIISFSVSVVIGLVFGYLPAKRAAKLNPIDALRSD